MGEKKYLVTIVELGAAGGAGGCGTSVVILLLIAIIVSQPEYLICGAKVLVIGAIGIWLFRKLFDAFLEWWFS